MNRFEKIIGFMALTFFYLSCFGQIAEVRTYGGELFEEGQQIITCTSGGYALVGTTSSDINSATNIYVQRLDENLNCIWNRVLGGANVDHGMSIIEDDQLNLIVCGFTNEGNYGGYDVVVYKLNSDGENVWRKTFGGSDWEFGNNIVLGPDGGYIICGSTFSDGNGDEDGLLLSVDAEGELLESFTFGYFGRDLFRSLSITETGQIVLGGSTENADGVSYAWLICLDSDYFTVWELVISNYEFGIITDIAISFDDQFLAVGKFNLIGDEENGFVLKISNEGSIVFDQLFGEVNMEGVAATEDFIYVVGNTTLFGLGGSSAVIFRLDQLGEWQNGAAFGDSDDEAANDVLIDLSSSVCMLGYSNSYSVNNGSDVYLVRFADPVIVNDYLLDLDYASCFDIAVKPNYQIKDFKVKFDAGQFAFDWINGSFFIEIRDCIGRLIYSNDRYENLLVVDKKNMATGLYVVSYSDAQGNNGRIKILL
jgi:hypothetical protein